MSEYKLTKKSLAIKLADDTGIPQKDGYEFIKLFLQTLKGALQKGRRIELRGFGVFKKLKSKKKFARDIKKNIKKPINKKYRLKFTPSEVVVRKIND